jgi:xylulokinase
VRGAANQQCSRGIQFVMNGEVMIAAYLGIDSGTQSTKAVLVEAEGGRILAQGRAPHALIATEPGQKEQHPAWWVQALIQAVREALACVPGVVVLGIGVSGQQHGFVVLDDRDDVLRPAKLWNDVTCAPQCDHLMNLLGGRAAAIRLTGNAILPGYTAGKVCWLKACEPALYARMKWMCLPHDYLNLWLTGERTMECGDASGTAFFDVRRRTWAPEVLRAIDPDRELTACLPPLLPSHAVAGRLRADAAHALGLPPGIPVSTGGGDNMMAAIGTGNVRPGAVTVSLGTSGTIFAYADTPKVDPDGEMAAFCDSTGAWLPLVCTMNVTGGTGMVRSWFGRSIEDLTRDVTNVPVGADGLLFLPYLEGERTPSMPTATGVFYGLGRGADSPGHVLRAVMEGATLGLRYGMDILKRLGLVPSTICLTGGGANNPVWRQICADVFGIPVVRSAVEEAAAYGAALQAKWAVSVESAGGPAKLGEGAAGWMMSLHESTIQEPIPTAMEQYEEIYETFRKLTAHLKPFFEQRG